MKKDILTINRAKWRSGDEYGNKSGKGFTQLLNTEGFMCCLGFRCLQLGFKKKDILGLGTPDDIATPLNKGIPLLTTKHAGRQTVFCDIAVSINDGRYNIREEREQALTKHFAKRGVTVVFKGKYPQL